MICPNCHGAGQIPQELRCVSNPKYGGKWIDTCRTCAGTKEVSEAQMQSFRLGEQIRQVCMEAGIRAWEAARELNMTANQFAIAELGELTPEETSAVLRSIRRMAARLEKEREE